jgi:TRAP-type C4-dicarboxylate transport system permease small subunit
MQARYVRIMDGLQLLCMAIAGGCLVVIALVIPWGVFTRYVLNAAASWPEPLAVLLMIWFSFMSAALCYRENLHIGVMIVPNLLQGRARTIVGRAIEACMAATALFMLAWGLRLVETTWNQAIAEFPLISVGTSYLPIPLGGAITLLFVIERLWTGRLLGAPADARLVPAGRE